MRHYVTPYNDVASAWARTMFFIFLGMLISFTGGSTALILLTLRHGTVPVYTMVLLGIMSRVVFWLGGALFQARQLARTPKH